LLVREGVAQDWPSLCKAFRFNRGQSHSGHIGLKETVEKLLATTLLTSKNGIKGPYKVNEVWEHIQRALGISLTQAANLTYYGSVAARPLFGKPRRLSSAPHLFVLMPFDRRLNATYRAICNAAKDLHLSVQRADELFSSSEIVRDIWTNIVNAGAIVADCTGRNPNVFYEIGIAHTIGKSIVLLTQASKDVPFDVAHIRHIRYSATSKGLVSLRRRLTATLRTLGEGIWDSGVLPTR